MLPRPFLLPNHTLTACSCAGIWSRTLTTKTGLPSGTVTKALKALESRKQVKTVKSVKVRLAPPSLDGDILGVDRS